MQKPLHIQLIWMKENNCKTIMMMPALQENQKTTAIITLMLKRIKKNKTTQQKILLCSSKYTATIISEIFGGVAFVKHLSDVLRESLSGCLEGIDSRLRIHPNMINILHAFDKCFSLRTKYPKRKRHRVLILVCHVLSQFSIVPTRTNNRCKE